MPEVLATNRNKAILFCNIFNVLNFGYMFFTKKATDSGVNGLDFCLIRSIISLMHGLIYIKCAGIPFYGDELNNNATNRKMITVRSIAGTIGFACYVFAIARLPLGITMIVFNTVPFWAALLGCILTREFLSPLELTCMICSFSGVLMIALSKPVDGELADDPKQKTIGLLCILTTAICFAIVNVFTRKMQKLNFAKVLAHYQCMATIVIGSILLLESLIMWQPLRILNYSKE